MKSLFGAEFRRVEHREHLGKPALVAVAVRSYPTTADDLWDAVTTPERVKRWFLPVEGEFRLGGRYQLQGNAGGTILRCERPALLELTWEMRGSVSWLHVRVEPKGKQAQLTLEHIAHRDAIGEEFLQQFGPGAVGVGWDLGLWGLALYLSNQQAKRDQAAAESWMSSDEGRAFVRGSGEGWREASIAAGEAPEAAQAQAERTIAFYTGG